MTKQRENRARLESSSGSGQKFEKRIEKSNDDLKKNVDAFNNALNIYEPNFVETTKIFTGTNSFGFLSKVLDFWKIFRIFAFFFQFEKDLETGHIDKLALYLRNVQTAYERNGLF